jgi:hypothetical protein
MRNYLIRDNENNILAIHKTPDSARFCFKKLTEKEDLPPFIYIQELETNDYGVVVRTDILATFSKVYSVILTEGDDETTSMQSPASD